MIQSQHAYCDVALAMNQRRNMSLAIYFGLIDSVTPKSSPRHRVIPAGENFFHIVDGQTGKVMGFRRDHNAACALARQLEGGKS